MPKVPKLPKLCRNPVQCAVAQAAAGVDWALLLCLAYTHRPQLSYLQTLQLSDTKSSAAAAGWRRKYEVTFGHSADAELLSGEVSV